MPADVDIVVEEEHDIHNALVIVGMPTLGVVGTIASQYLVDQLQMPEVGGIYSPRFPPVGRIQQGRSGFPVRLHALETRCGLDLTCEHLAVAVTEFLPSPQSMYALAEALAAWANETDAAGVVIPDGLLVRASEGAVHGVAATEKARSALEKAEVEMLDEGVVAGFSAAMIANGRRRNVDAFSILAESAHEHPDSRAAARLVQVLDAFVPEIDIETKPLLEEAQRIEERAQSIRREIEQRSERADAPFDQMYT